jgi:hypothetical protein
MHGFTINRSRVQTHLHHLEKLRSSSNIKRSSLVFTDCSGGWGSSFHQSVADNINTIQKGPSVAKFAWSTITKVYNSNILCNFYVHFFRQNLDWTPLGLDLGELIPDFLLVKWWPSQSPKFLDLLLKDQQKLYLYMIITRTPGLLQTFLQINPLISGSTIIET